MKGREIVRIYPNWTIEDHQTLRASTWCAEYAAHVEDGLQGGTWGRVTALQTADPRQRAKGRDRRAIPIF